MEIENDGTIIYDRKLQDGNGKDFYGYKFAQTIINNKEFLNISSDINDSIYKQ